MVVPTLSVRNGPRQGTAYTLAQPVVIIGRGSSADLPLPDASVSRHHAVIARENEEWGIKDLDSANGTFVNGRRISRRVPLVTGDSVRLGSVVLKFDAAAAPPGARPAVVEPPTEPKSRVLLRVTPEMAGEGGPLFGTIKRSRILDNLKKMGALVFDEKALLGFVAEELLAGMPQADRALVLLWDAALTRFVPSATRTRSNRREWLETSQAMLEGALKAREAILVSNAAADPGAEGGSKRARKVTSAICAPILFQDDLFGVVRVDSTSMTRPFTRADVAASLALSIEVGAALAYARAHAKIVERAVLEGDRELSRAIRKRFAPLKPPELGDYTFAAAHVPASRPGGDFYDFVGLADGRLAVAVGKAPGSGVPAALAALKAMTELRTHAGSDASASTILTRINAALLAQNDDSMFVTLALTVIDSARHRLTAASAGHPLPIVRDAAGPLANIGGKVDKPLGLDIDAAFSEHEYAIDAGDRIVLYTDGVLDAVDGSGAPYGETRLADAIRRPAADAGAIVQAIAADVRAFAGSRAPMDDLTIVCVERKAT